MTAPVIPDPGTVVHVGRTGLHGTVGRAHGSIGRVRLVLVEYAGPCSFPILEGWGGIRRVCLDLGDSARVYEHADDLTIVGGERS